jgi:hypothetical protein
MLIGNRKRYELKIDTETLFSVFIPNDRGTTSSNHFRNPSDYHLTLYALAAGAVSGQGRESKEESARDICKEWEGVSRQGKVVLHPALSTMIEIRTKARSGHEVAPCPACSTSWRRDVNKQRQATIRRMTSDSKRYQTKED